jgi:hypothetical protein
MRCVLFHDPQDGPSRELCHQLDFSRFFAKDAVITDHHSLYSVLDHAADPVTVCVLMPQSGEHWPSSRIMRDILPIRDRAHTVVLMLTETDILIDHLRAITRLPNVRIMAPAQHNFGVGHQSMIMWQHWVQDLRLSWQQAAMQSCFDDISHINHRPYLFDVLLGGERSYRSLLYDLVESTPDLRDRVLMTYYGRPGTRPRFISEPEIGSITWQDPMHTSLRVRYRSVEMRVACIPPISIYRQTWFTVLAETSAHGYLNFYTEKVAKPLLAGRMFLAIGGQHYLRGLRDSGFQTFGSVIDESYDLEPDDNARVVMIFHEMQRLLRCDPVEVLRRVQPMIAHNQRLAWQQDFASTALATARHCAQHPSVGLC